jgi:hypothetical protein
MEGVTPPEIITLLPLEKDRGRLRDVVGSNLAYVVNGNKAKLKSSTGKQVDCTIVRVANAAPPMK